MMLLMLMLLLLMLLIMIHCNVTTDIDAVIDSDVVVTDASDYSY